MSGRQTYFRAGLGLLGFFSQEVNEGFTCVATLWASDVLDKVRDRPSKVFQGLFNGAGPKAIGGAAVQQGAIYCGRYLRERCLG